MFGLGRAGLAIGPGSLLTPGIAGDRSVVKLTPVATAFGDAARSERLPAVAALAVATQENRTKAPIDTAISTFRGLCSVKCLIIGLPLTFFMVRRPRLEVAASALRLGDDHNSGGRMQETQKTRATWPAVG